MQSPAAMALASLDPSNGDTNMIGPLVLVAALVLAAYAVGYWVGREDGHAQAMRWRGRIDRMGKVMQAAQSDEPVSPRLKSLPS